MTKFCLLLLTFIGAQNINCLITFSEQEVFLGLNETKQVGISVTGINQSNTLLVFDVEEKGILNVKPHKILLQLENGTYNVTIEGVAPGHSDVALILNSSINTSFHFAANVYKSNVLNILSPIVGWIFIISWGCLYYPQLYTNYKRKCVIGLNFDYLAFNIIGHVSFAIFILGLYFNPKIQMKYFKRSPRSLIPVKLNDVVYDLHGIIATLLIIFQCCIYKKDNQRVSVTATSFIFLILVMYLACITLQRLSFIDWLDFLYFCSYVKLVIALLKYIPQAYMNYKRKSTHGWSIGLVFLDLNGGVFSLIQMILDAYNYNDWVSLLGNATKFILGILCILFHLLFLTQHFILYRRTNNYLVIP